MNSKVAKQQQNLFINMAALLMAFLIGLSKNNKLTNT